MVVPSSVRMNEELFFSRWADLISCILKTLHEGRTDLANMPEYNVSVLRIAYGGRGKQLLDELLTLVAAQYQLQPSLQTDFNLGELIKQTLQFKVGVNAIANLFAPIERIVHQNYKTSLQQLLSHQFLTAMVRPWLHGNTLAYLESDECRIPRDQLEEFLLFVDWGSNGDFLRTHPDFKKCIPSLEPFYAAIEQERLLQVQHEQQMQLQQRQQMQLRQQQYLQLQQEQQMQLQQRQLLQARQQQQQLQLQRERQWYLQQERQWFLQQERQFELQEAQQLQLRQHEQELQRQQEQEQRLQPQKDQDFQLEEQGEQLEQAWYDDFSDDSVPGIEGSEDPEEQNSEEDNAWECTPLEEEQDKQINEEDNVSEDTPLEEEQQDKQNSEEDNAWECTPLEEEQDKQINEEDNVSEDTPLEEEQDKQINEEDNAWECTPLEEEQEEEELNNEEDNASDCTPLEEEEQEEQNGEEENVSESSRLEEAQQVRTRCILSHSPTAEQHRAEPAPIEHATEKQLKKAKTKRANIEMLQRLKLSSKTLKKQIKQIQRTQKGKNSELFTWFTKLKLIKNQIDELEANQKEDEPRAKPPSLFPTPGGSHHGLAAAREHETREKEKKNLMNHEKKKKKKKKRKRKHKDTYVVLNAKKKKKENEETENQRLKARKDEKVRQDVLAILSDEGPRANQTEGSEHEQLTRRHTRSKSITDQSPSRNHLIPQMEANKQEQLSPQELRTRKHKKATQDLLDVDEEPELRSKPRKHKTAKEAKKKEQRRNDEKARQRLLNILTDNESSDPIESIKTSARTSDRSDPIESIKTSARTSDRSDPIESIKTSARTSDRSDPIESVKTSARTSVKTSVRDGCNKSSSSSHIRSKLSAKSFFLH